MQHCLLIACIQGARLATASAAYRGIDRGFGDCRIVRTFRQGRLGGCFALTRCHVFLGVYETVAEQRTRSFLHGLLLDLRASVVNGCSRTWGSTRAGLIGVRE